ncbi:MAG: carbon storage regulator CsrA [Verrucomicrobiae bacterium]|nr:carbon storage regulator CsrA [Verrucomicrobiae bacterium]
MLVITRKEGEGIMLGDHIEVVVVSIDGNQIRLGFKAPTSISIQRKELYERIQQANRQAAANKQTTHLPRFSPPS